MSMGFKLHTIVQCNIIVFRIKSSDKKAYAKILSIYADIQIIIIYRLLQLSENNSHMNMKGLVAIMIVMMMTIIITTDIGLDLWTHSKMKGVLL